MLEWFVSGADYNGVMDFAEELVAERRRAGDGDDQGRARRRGDRLRGALAAGRRCATSCCEETGRRHLPRRAATSWPSWPATTPSPTTTGPALVDTLQGKLVEPKLIQPTFIIDLPLDIWPLVKPRPETPSCSARPSTGSSPGWRSSAAAPTSTTRSSSARRFVEQRERQESGAEDDPAPARRRVRAGARIRDADRRAAAASASTA